MSLENIPEGSMPIFVDTGYKFRYDTLYEASMPKKSSICPVVLTEHRVVTDSHRQTDARLVPAQV